MVSMLKKLIHIPLPPKGILASTTVMKSMMLTIGPPYNPPTTTGIKRRSKMKSLLPITVKDIQNRI
ncbi:hypothetical protein SAMD00020551_4736 [Mesobacillus selenatarsenatis SF-1]|uniref:Uncharacterized protein n=1 Tax=Mesobacillus selenatarsenatis (strain DSM 18680 / JCM 14380 / FERM P-15431 / SF-1) TaxID=1321606 RepID=A0A0A8X9C6_MESS1|nr:hypothetical protein SAMD00020551_4736 [Mesobacillus selenatarsenatis SF-1]